MKNSIVLVVLLMVAVTTQARWKQTSSFDGGEINSLTVSGDTIFAATEKGIFVTTDNGGNWSEKNNGLTNLSVNSIVVNGKYIFAGTAGGVFLSTNSGDKWSAVLTKEESSTINVTSLAIKEGVVFAATRWKGIYISKDNGSNWTVSNNGLPSLAMNAISVGNNSIYAGTYNNGVFRSTDNGDSWAAINSGLTDKYILSVTADGDSVFAGTLFKGVFLSTDKGVNWKQINTGLTRKSIRSIVVKGSNVFAAAMGGDGGGVFQSEDYGENWKAINDGLSQWKMTALCILGDNVFVGDRYGRVFIQADLITSVDEQLLITDNTILLEQNYPNPFTKETTIKYRVPVLKTDANTTLKVYDILGNEVQTLVDDKKVSGEYSINFNGALLPSGVYFYKLTSGNYSNTKQMIIKK